jgi:uncharacterized protein (DUF433 family)
MPPWPHDIYAISIISTIRILERYEMSALLDRIVMNPAINHGKPVIRGLRYPVETLLELLSAGMTIVEILADYRIARKAAVPLGHADERACVGLSQRSVAVAVL